MVYKFALTMILCAIITCILALVILFWRGKKIRRIRPRNRLVVPVVCLFVSVLFMHLARYSVTYSDGWNMLWHLPKIVMISITHSLQSFSMDENYDAMVSILQSFFQENYAEGIAIGLTGFVLFENILAPVLGGAFILDILSDIFPGLRLSRITIFRKKRVFIFSELNSESLAVMADLRRLYPHGALVVSDTYVTPGEESQVEMLERARHLGAICISEDIMELRVTGSRQTEYFLMDREEDVNMRTLASLSSNEIYRKIWKRGDQKVRIHFFTDNVELDSMVESANAEFERKGYPNVLVKIVSVSENLTYSLLEEYPLYQAVDAKKQKLSVAILGDSNLGRKCFETIYWSGQMLNPYKEQLVAKPELIPLDIHMVCKGAGKLQQDYAGRCPEMFKRNVKNHEAIALDFVQISFDELDSQHMDSVFKKLIEANYVLVHTGNDSQNIRLAESLKRYFDKEYIGEENKIKIHVIVEDDDLLAIQQKIFRDQLGYASIHCFGNLKKRYGYESLYRYEGKGDARALYKDMYSNRSNSASAFYMATRLFSAGIFKDLADADTDVEASQIKTSGGDSKLTGTSGVASKAVGTFSKKVTEAFRKHIADPESCQLKNWEEKNRWNAYTRVSGYSCPSTKQALDFYQEYGNFKLHKVMYHSKKVYYLHPCLLDLAVASADPFESMEKDDFEKLHKILYRKAQTEYLSASEKEKEQLLLKYPDFEDYLLHMKGFLSEEHASYDALDILSILSCEDYKRYDRNQMNKIAEEKRW